MAPSSASSGARRPLGKRAGIIDVHHHILPPTAPEGMTQFMAGRTPQRAIAEMDRAGIGYPGPIREGTDAERGEKARARAWNAFGASLTRDFPGRFGLFASLPFPGVGHVLAEIDFALDQFGADGFGVATSYGEQWLGDDAFWPIWAKLDARRAVVFVHPHDAACCAPDTLSYNRPGMEAPGSNGR